MKQVHPSIFYPRLLPNRANRFPDPNQASSAGDPPVEAIISEGRQVLLQIPVGLLDLPAEVLELAVQRVLRAAVHDAPGGWNQGRSGARSSAEQRAAGAARPRMETAVLALLVVSPQIKEQKDRKQKHQEATETTSSAQRPESPVCSGSAPRTETRN